MGSKWGEGEGEGEKGFEADVGKHGVQVGGITGNQ